MLLWLVFFALFLLCAGMCAVFSVYTCVLWFAALGRPLPNAKAIHRGLSPSQLEMIAGVEDGGLAKGTECAVCLDDIEEGQPARVMPDCRHAFHQQCADGWLSSNAVCPMCRAPLLLPRPPLPPDDQPPRVDDAVV